MLDTQQALDVLFNDPRVPGLVSENSRTRYGRRGFRSDVPNGLDFLTSLQMIFRGETGRSRSVDRRLA